jgi:hypothetical protein
LNLTRGAALLPLFSIINKQVVMNLNNRNYTKNTNVTDKDVTCECGKELHIFHVSNWHDGTGIFYSECPSCGRVKNIPWKRKEAANA